VQAQGSEVSCAERTPDEFGVKEGCDHRTGRAIDVHGHVGPAARRELVELRADVRDGLVAAVKGGAEDGDDGYRVLIAELDRGLRVEVEALALHRHEALLHLKVVREALPAHLHVAAHHDVRLRAAVRALREPAALEREPREHARLGRARRAAPRRLGAGGRVPEVREDAHAAALELRGARVLVLVDHVLERALCHQLRDVVLSVRARKSREV
jgi:hypothetical protein